MNDNTITVLVVEPERKPYVKEISPGLASLQREVGGYIQAVFPFEEPVAVVCDEEAKLKGSQLNRALRDDEGHIYDVVAGTFLVVGMGEEDFSSLHPDHIMKFSDLYKTPELFIHMDGKLVVLPMEEREKAKKPSVHQTINQPKADKAKSSPKRSHAKEER